MLHVSPPLGTTGALGLLTTRTVCGPGALLLPVRPRDLQTHVQKIFHRSDGGHRPSSHGVPVLPLYTMGTDQTVIHSKNTSARQTRTPSLLATLLKGEILFLRKQHVFHPFPCFSGEGEQLDLRPHRNSLGPGPGCSHEAAGAKDPRGPCLTLGLRLNLSHFVHGCQRWESFLFWKLDNCHGI